MTKEWTSVSVTESQKEQLESAKPDGMAMGAFLVSLIESHSNKASGAIDSNECDIAELQDQLDRIENAQGGTVSDSLDVAENSVSYDDVKQAAQAAIREELPVERMGQ